ncbi:MAG: L,D-transpeptidase [Gemmatimonadaceae bacterium]|nr:L,D-transpeptidase [Gemmatimonadaceae bacterium]
MSYADAFRFGGRSAWMLIAGFVAVAAVSAMLVTRTAELRYERDVNRMVFNDNLGVLEEVRAKLGTTTDSLKSVLASAPVAAADQPYIVVSIAERKIWFKRGNTVLFQAPVATGSGKEFVSGTNRYRFQTPRGRLVVQQKQVNPAWVPPDWHYQEQAKKRGLGVVKLSRNESVPTGDGGLIYASGSELVKRSANGTIVSLGGGSEDREVVAGGNIIIPPFGTNARRYEGVLGTRRLTLGDGYGIHGTNKPETVGQAVSHGCVRMRNEDIERLFEMVPVGTPVYLY